MFTKQKITKKRQNTLAFCLNQNFQVRIFKNTHKKQKSHYDYFGKIQTTNDRNYLIEDSDAYYWSPTISNYEMDYYFDKAIMFTDLDSVILFINNHFGHNEIESINISICNYYTQYYVANFKKLLHDLTKLIKKGNIK